MNLINKKLLQQRLHSFEFPNPEKLIQSKLLLERWVKALKDSDLEGTKEKSVQGKFLSTFFEDVLGYSDVTTGNEEWTLIQHPRIENDSKEPDGSLGWFTKDKKVTRAVIELKDAKAQLDKKQNRGSEKLTPIEQAYLYATKYEGCNWIIVSNFKEIRLYNKHRTQEYYEKFDVVDLVQDTELKRFYFLLSKENLISKEKESVIDVLAKDTTEAEQDITKKFYSEFREVRLTLLGHLSDNNPQFEKEILLEKTQKLLDRFIFTLFCEDTSTLLPLNLVKNTYERAINSLSPSDERVWTEFKGLFLAIDKGNDRVKPPINAYNGGLFAFDEVLDTLSIKDDFWANLMHLTEYDFETDLNVNILGHIFEQSISDLESLKSELRGEEQDKKKSKRKKDGIFYTPEYITRYIVENTVGKYLEEHPDRLETIKILDPACGSGAFLNQAHSFLVKEYSNRYEAKINEKLEKGESITLFDYNPAENNRNILLNNLYGVDLNRESVEITKLALWLKTARATEPLQNLDKNIKTGNSLIDDPEIASKKAFNWKNEFSEIMNNGGFDVVVGNPPYVSNKLLHKNNQVTEKLWMDEHYYSTKSGNYDLFIPFIEKGLSLTKKGGYLSFIIPNKFLIAKYSKNILKLIQEKYSFVEVLDLSNLNVFEDVSVYPVIIIIKNEKGDNLFVKRNKLVSDVLTLKEESIWDFENQRPVFINSDKHGSIIEKIENIETCNEFLDYQPGINGFQFSNYSKCVSEGRIKENDKRLVVTGAIDPFLLLNAPTKFKGTLYSTPYITFDKEIISEGKWDLFDSPKVLVAGMTKNIEALVDKDGIYAPAVSVYSVLSKTINLHYIGSLLNSKLVNWYFKIRFSDKHLAGGYISINNLLLKEIPLAKPQNSENLILKVEKLTDAKEQFQNELDSAHEFIRQNFNLEFSKNKSVDIFHLGWNILMQKNGNKLNIDKEEKLFNWFKEKQKQLGIIKTTINRLTDEINLEIYRVYGLTDEEIKIIEESYENK